MENERIPYTACPLCQSTEIHPLTLANCTGHAMWREPLEPTIPWVQCGHCQHVFTKGYFTDEALNILYSNVPGGVTIFDSNIEQNRNISAKMIERVVSRIGLPNDRVWLDVGFGNGSLLLTAKEFGFDCMGIEFMQRNIEEIQQFGIRAYQGKFEEMGLSVAVDSKPAVISMADVVEHEPFPLDSLRYARELISDPGVLLISMPNTSAPLWHHWNANNQNPYWQEINHYHNFTRENLYAALRKSGFEPAHYNISERYRCCMEVLAEAV
jgi:hypothetical protein